MASYAGFFAQVPQLAAAWQLSPAAAGTVSGAFYAGYMLSVPILVTLTDRVDPRRVYLASMSVSAVATLAFALVARGMWSAAVLHCLMGIGLAGTYMPGLRLLTDRLAGLARSRAVALYTGSYALGAALSFLLIGALSRQVGWRWAFAGAGAGPLLALAGVGMLVAPLRRDGIDLGALRLFTHVRPILADRAVLARAIAYAAHNFELFGLWSWAVAFLSFAYGERPGEPAPIAATTVTAILSFSLLPASVLGNEIAGRLGPRRWIIGVMIASAAIAGGLGFVAGTLATPLVIGLCIIYGITTAAELGALTASLVAVADPRRHGTTMALYSMIGFAGSFAGPVVFGIVLEVFGTRTPAGWGMAFLAMGLGALAGPAAIILLDRKEG